MKQEQRDALAKRVEAAWNLDAQYGFVMAWDDLGDDDRGAILAVATEAFLMALEELQDNNQPQ